MVSDGRDRRDDPIGDDGGVDARRERLIAEHPDLYENHLEIAAWIERWAKRLELSRASEHVPTMTDIDHLALRRFAAAFESGDLLPGGPLLDANRPGEARRRS